MAEVTDIDQRPAFCVMKNTTLRQQSSPPALAITTLAMTTGKGGSRIENGGKCAGNATPYFVAFEAAERKLIRKKPRPL